MTIFIILNIKKEKIMTNVQQFTRVITAVLEKLSRNFLDLNSG